MSLGGRAETALVSNHYASQTAPSEKKEKHETGKVARALCDRLPPGSSLITLSIQELRKVEPLVLPLKRPVCQ